MFPLASTAELNTCQYSSHSAKIQYGTLAARGLEEQRRNFEQLLTKSVGRVHFP